MSHTVKQLNLAARKVSVLKSVNILDTNNDGILGRLATCI